MRKSNQKLPPEVHNVRGTVGENPGIELPERVKMRVPFAEWAKDTSMFTKERFVKETADYLYDVYGLGTDQDKHIMMMLADQIEMYIEARKKQEGMPLVVTTNGGKTYQSNPFITIANKAMDNAVKLMGELGLTPRTRLTADKVKQPEEGIGSFLNGWQAGSQQ